MSEPLWASGPAEILRHGISLLAEDSDTNRRLAMISIDNSVELMMQTFITLPQRVTGLSISRRERDDICRNFPALLDGIEKYGGDIIVGFDLGDIEWFHRLRNQLYHDGNGLTVERTKVELYAQLAQRLLKELYGIELEIEDTGIMKQYGEFLDTWGKIESKLREKGVNGTSFLSQRSVLKNFQSGNIGKEDFDKFLEVRKARNELVHGHADPSDTLNRTLLELAKDVLSIVTRMPSHP